MLDTLGFRSPPLDVDLADRLDLECRRKSETVLRTGEIRWEITQGDLVGSHDARISFRVERQRWITDGRSPPIRVQCPPYLTVEGSVHKLLAGHNCYGGPTDLRACGAWLVRLIEDAFECSLPPIECWELRRIDWAEVWDLKSYQACEEFMRGLVHTEFPRRKKLTYGLETIFFPGHTTTNKIYHKGPEFSKHDRKRLLKLDRDNVVRLQSEANNLIRAEVGIKAEKLDYDFGRAVTVCDINQDYLIGIFITEITRIIRESKQTMKRVRTAREVQARLHQKYSTREASVLFGSWLQLSSLGENALKKSLPRSTFYRHRKMLQDAGCSWHSSDVVLRRSTLIPTDFALTLDSPYRVVSIDPKVAAALAPHMPNCA